ncbi:hypothetical protein IU459_27005 [Nocardia amamiensis]|uniref:Uncharacterized protein n=1 Tax=Nocardia amamiensis TaxID=404578 RepID=A0ABS0CX42_9NOCA|nr:hypothetical protein [Nocardia amamiensis]MBF6301165.1 hypothetical protein [Nocardia amamiensis]
MLWDWLDRLKTHPGGAYRSALLQDPDVVEQLAAADDAPAADVPLEGFDRLDGWAADILDRLTQIVYATLRADIATAPTTPRPTLPHITRRAEYKRQRDRAFELQLIPGGE